MSVVLVMSATQPQGHVSEEATWRGPHPNTRMSRTRRVQRRVSSVWSRQASLPPAEPLTRALLWTGSGAEWRQARRGYSRSRLPRWSGAELPLRVPPRRPFRHLAPPRGCQLLKYII
ncbi:hypothetical protein E2C01_057909 [Portunus trituberculatus]|uniref:Uncharacterized protein n=1 Tax=Portunus trituberculatus TaxID=210409 RepID=A0A5B7H193_PORTR|nr:hypothetical protein [Portunus trituberculatus]